MARTKLLRNLAMVAAAALGAVLLHTIPAHAQLYDWTRNWDCGGSRGAVWHVKIYDPGPADHHTIFSYPGGEENSFSRSGPVDQSFYLSGSKGTAQISLGHNPYWDYNPEAAIDLGRTRVTCEP